MQAPLVMGDRVRCKTSQKYRFDISEFLSDAKKIQICIISDPATGLYLGRLPSISVNDDE
jgi:hypothetical protein